MEKPKISIITITYNSEKTLEDTIKSVIAQGYPNLEYLIIDGGSKDKTMDIVDKYREYIAFAISEPDKGISDAFNKGINNATGEIIGILNSDDLMLKGTLDAIAENYDPNVNVYSQNILIWNGKDKSYKEIPDMNFSIYNVSHHVSHQGRFITKKTYEQMGKYDVRLKYMMDVDLLLRLYNRNAKFKYINHDAALFRLGATTSDSIWKKKNDVRITNYNNGGNIFSFYYKWYMLILRHFIKYLMDLLFGSEAKRYLRYVVKL